MVNSIAQHLHGSGNMVDHYSKQNPEHNNFGIRYATKLTTFPTHPFQILAVKRNHVPIFHTICFFNVVAIL